MNDIQAKLKEIGVSIIDETNGKYRNLEDIMTDVAKAFKNLKSQNKGENIIDDICETLAGGEGIRDRIKNKSAIKSLLFNL